MFFLESGRLTVLFERDDEPSVRVRTMRPGTVVGEMSLYRAVPASATVVAEMPSVVMRLSVDNFRLMKQAEPTAAAWLHWFVAVTLAGANLGGAEDRSEISPGSSDDGGDQPYDE